MEIPLYVFALVYLCFLGVFLLWAFFNFYHLIKYGFFDFVGKLNGFIFFGFTIVIVGVTILLLKDVPWFDTVSINTFMDSNQIFNLDNKTHSDL